MDRDQLYQVEQDADPAEDCYEKGGIMKKEIIQAHPTFLIYTT